MGRLGLDQSTDRARYIRIAGEIRGRILRGEIPEGQRLPTTRAMARRTKVNRNTVVAAYHKLAEWGFARSHVGRGTFAVRPAEPSPERRPEPAPEPASPRLPARGTPPWEGAFSRALGGRRGASVPAVPARTGSARAISLAGSFPASDLLPARGLLAALEATVREGASEVLAYTPALGYPPLREWIAGDMSRRGIPAVPEEILITNGSQQAIDLIARALVDPGDTVLIENPTYTGAISVFESVGARLSGLPLDEEGIAPGAVARAAARGRAKLLYATPTLHNPTTASLSLPRRRALLEEASEAGLLVIEDDWAGGLRFEGDDPPTLRALDSESRVIYLSTFAKKLIPGLRIGWIAAAREVVERLAVLKQISDCCSSALVQAALVEFCRTGDLDRHLRRIRAAYLTRRDRMLAALRRHAPARVTWSEPAGGLFLWVRLPAGVDTAAIQAEAEARGVLISVGDPFYIEGRGPASLRITFASARPAEIDRGIQILGTILKKQLSAADRRRTGAALGAVPLV